MALEVGLFELDSAIGKGAMGQVWAAHHMRDETAVAIKFLSVTEDAWALEAFRNEVRAAAGLAHPGIVRVLDHGVVSEDDSAAVDGEFAVGGPFLVMELVRGHPLHRYVGRLPWVRLKDLLLQLLDALAHSHARGVVHRDLKPGNVLLTEQRGRIRAMLTDFGLAHAVDRGSKASHVVAGTPAYMAPEQFEGRFRDQGPWTDLYSLGCLTWALVSRRAPFGRGLPFEELRDAHLRASPPPLNPVIPVPEGLEAWLRRLLAKREHQRFQRAADAAWGLMQLGDVLIEPKLVSAELEPLHGSGSGASGSSASGSSGSRPGGSAEDSAPATLPPQAMQSLVLDLDASPTCVDRDASPRRDKAIALAEVEGAMPVVPVPMPITWRRPAQPRTPRQLLGVGLNLYELRLVPLVGRERERDELWRGLQRVHDLLRPQVVVLEGPSGCGKSRLARWLGERADETGSALSMTVTSSAEGGPGTGLEAMLSRFFRCTDLKRRGLRRRVERLLSRGGLDLALLDSITELMLPAEESERRHASAVLFAGQAEKHALLSGVLEWVTWGHTPRRPAVVVVDDAQWASEALQYVLRVIEEDELPVLFVLTVQDEALAERPGEQRLIEQLKALPQVRRLEIGPLDEAEHHHLVKDLLGMEGELVERVARRTAGNPLFAEQLVGDWVARGILYPGLNGFRLQEGATVDLPEDMLTVWGDRIERILGEYSGPERRSLELAAVLGLDVNMREWRTTCRAANLEPSVELLGRLFQESLASPAAVGDGWSFSHAMVRETLVRRARDKRRLSRHHQACARMLERTFPGEQLERLGRHQLLSGQPDAALDTLAQAARRLAQRGEHAAAVRLWDYRERAMTVLDPPPSDRRWGEGWLGRAQASRVSGDFAAHAEYTTRLLNAARTHGWSRLLIDAMRNRSRSLLRAGRMDEAARLLEDAIVDAQRQRDEEALGSCRRDLASVHYRRGRYESARYLLTHARRHFEAVDDDLGVANCLMNLARVELSAGTVERGLELIGDALQLYQANGSIWQVADACVIRGELHRHAGHLEAAEEDYQRAADLMASSGHPTREIPLANIGLIQLHRGQFALARSTLEGLVEDVRTGMTPMIAASLHIALLACCAAQGDAPAFDRNHSLARRMLADTGFVDTENAQLADRAARLATRRGWKRRAGRAWTLAIEQWEALGREDEARIARAQLSQMNQKS